MSKSLATPRTILIAIAAFGSLAGCAGWDGPGNWVNKSFLAGLPASACAAADSPLAADYPAVHKFNIGFSRWSGSVHAQAVTCIEHTDPLHASKAAWVECRVTGPALITHTPAIDGAETFVAPVGAFDLRANRIGLSCKPIK